ncbi:glycoside hydrolase family 2 TIM barrel-domain containing protein [Saccharobesus litoralis]|nr:glycoside hydrolase family 2 TIM barrel-domain containing protein [Saccharobesus litoralis]
MLTKLLRIILRFHFLLIIGSCPLLASQPLNVDWRFQLGDNPAFALANFDDSQWRQLSIPHDWSIEDIPGTTSPFSAQSQDKYDTGYSVGGVGWYRKHLPPLNAEQQYFVHFDGVYMQPQVFVNGQLAYQQTYGYTGFSVDITPYIVANKNNVLAVRVHNPEKNSRWYSGSGIYRQVTLSQHGHVYFVPNTATVVTQQADSHRATLHIANELAWSRQAEAHFRHNNDLAKSISLKSQIYIGERLIASEQRNIALDKAKTTQLTKTVQIDKPQRWQPSDPHLYQLKQTLYLGKKPVDSLTTTFGIRTLDFNSQTGFLLNKQPMLLKGMNIHHDNYLLGAAAHPVAEERKVKRILAAGYNAVRSAHNPPSSAFLDAADRHGLLVINEVFDSWNEKKWDHVNGYAAVFQQEWQHDLKRFVQRDRNHPSVIMWSLGNEIPEQWNELGRDTAAKLIAYAKRFDTSRPFTIGANISGDAGKMLLPQFDVVGYNYQPHNYQHDFAKGYSQIMYGSETYPNQAYEYWQFVKDKPFVIGDFVWTGWDYLGEASIGWTGYAPEWQGLADYPWTLAYCGDIDALGNKRPAAYYRDVLWQTGQHSISMFVESPTLSLQPEPKADWYLNWTYADIHPNWTWPGFEGKKLNVSVFTQHPYVELVLNNQVIASKYLTEHDQLTAKFAVTYQPGQLVAKGYDKDKKLQATWTLTSSEKPQQIAISPEPKALKADGYDISYVPIQLLDQSGNPVYFWQYDQTLTVSVTGGAKLLALGNADPRSNESFKQNKRRTFRGKLLAVIQSNQSSSAVNIRVTGQGLKPATLSYYPITE